ncbi:uncharacterized protein LOC125531379 isoform X2 [Triticum urartu]|uniref:uncharacterized protein LOC125531379 isoform X2 n=1 Tax=Triticum urartu TaxID=4572 RepID=UPI0020442311|nr:uncharacterized protein LOC125531379 isoform X2 [Triticum urartu]
MATAWDVASVGWSMVVLGWLVSPVITLILPKILSCLGFDAAQKLQELEISIMPELQNRLHAVDQERMMQSGKKPNSDVAALDKMAAMLRHAREDAEDIFDDAQERIVSSYILDGVVQTFKRSCLGIACFIQSGSAQLMQWPRSSLCRFLQRASGEAVTIGVAASNEPGHVTIDVAAPSGESVPVTTSAAASHEPTVPSSDSLGRWLSSFSSSIDLVKYCCTSSFNWLRFYRDWSYEVVGVTSYEENATALDVVLTAISRWNLKKRIEKIESTISEVTKSPLLATANKSATDDIANKYRSIIRIPGKRKSPTVARMDKEKGKERRRRRRKRGIWSPL